jgi:hypothetical protein
MAKKDTPASVLTPEQREEMRKTRDEMAKEKVTPPRGTTKQSADIFVEGIEPPKDDEGSVKQTKPVKKAKGGYVRAADGCAQRGKTRGKMV